MSTDHDNNERHEITDASANSRLPPPTIGARVMAMYQGARRPGTVLTVNDKRGLFKMRFDEFPTAEFDYSFNYKSSAWSYIPTTPSSSTTIETTTNVTTEEEPLFTIARKFKALIKVNNVHQTRKRLNKPALSLFLVYATTGLGTNTRTNHNYVL